MLDFFLILGQIPGTNLTITFTELVWFGFIFVAASALYLRSVFQPQDKQRPTIWDSLINYDVPKVAKSIARNRSSLAIDSWLAWRDRHWRIIP